MLLLENTKQKNRINEATMSQAFWGMFPALVIANIIPALSNVINGLIVGNSYTEEAMSAISFATPVLKFVGAGAVLAASGANIVYGRYLGRGDSEKIHKVFTADIEIVLILGTTLTLLGELFIPQIVHLIGATGEISIETIRYFRGLFIGFIPTLLIPSLVAFLNLGNEAKYGMASSAILAGANLLLGLINVHVLKGTMFGMGLVSSMSQYMAVIFLIRKFIKRKELGHIVKITGEKQIVKDILFLGIPAAILEIATSFRNIVINAETLKAGGTFAAQAMGILASSSGFFCAVLPAAITTTTTIMSITVGEGNAHYLKKEASYLLKTSAIICITTGLCYFLFSPWISMIFGAKGISITYGNMCIRLYCIELFIGWFFFVLLGIYQTLRRMKLYIIMQILSILVYPTATIFLFRGLLGIVGIWLCYGIAAFLSSITLVIVSWIKNKKFPKSISDMLWLDNNFDVSEENRFSITVNSLDDVVKIAKNVQDFCINRGIDEKKALFMAICLEEMAGNIISHGFTKASNKKQKSLVIDISIAISDSEVLARIRDNAPHFDPFKKLEMYQLKIEDPSKNIGIRIVSKMAKEMKYQSTLGMNVLSIKM